MGTLSIFFGHASNAEARVYAQWQEDDPASLSGVTISGTITGPKSSLAHTLPAKMPFRFLGAGEFPLAEAIVPDPCFWTPDNPYTYQVQIEVQRQGEVVQQTNQLFGIRPLGTRGRSFYLDGRRWVLRGGFSPPELQMDPANCRDAAISLVSTFGPGDSLLPIVAASQLGVLVVGHLVGEEQALARLESLSCWPSVGMVLLDTSLAEQAIVEHRPRNVLLGQRLRVDETNPEFQPAAWADFVVGDVDDPALFVVQTKDLSLPVVACRHDVANRSHVDVRAACERLQADLAPYGDFAGYLV